MGFHYGYEKRKFDAEWTRLEQEYRAAGMDDRQIAAMKEYDWTWFCRMNCCTGGSANCRRTIWNC